VRPEITRLVTDLDAFVKKAGKEDARAIECVTQLGALYEKCNEKERTAIVKEVGRALRDPRRRPDKQSRECRLALASSAAHGSMGDAGAKELVPALDLKHFEINGPLIEEAIAAPGRTRAKAAVEPLLEMAGKRSLSCVRGASRRAAWPTSARRTETRARSSSKAG
jgi:hypothetical protein